MQRCSFAFWGILLPEEVKFSTKQGRKCIQNSIPFKNDWLASFESHGTTAILWLAPSFYFSKGDFYFIAFLTLLLSNPDWHQAGEGLQEA